MWLGKDGVTGPAEFIAEDEVVRVGFGLEEFESAGWINFYFEGKVWRGSDFASIGGNLDFIPIAVEVDDEGMRVVEDNGAIGERVGVDGGNDHDGGGGVDDGSAGGKVVGGGAGGGGDNDPVGVVGVHIFLLAMDLESDEVGGAGLDDNIVEGEGLLLFGTAKIEQRKVSGGVVSVEEILEFIADGMAGEAGHEAEPTQVDPEHGHTRFGSGLDYTEKGPVAADNNAEVGALEFGLGEGEIRNAGCCATGLIGERDEVLGESNRSVLGFVDDNDNLFEVRHAQQSCKELWASQAWWEAGLSQPARYSWLPFMPLMGEGQVPMQVASGR